MFVYTVPDKLTVTWNPDVSAIITKWDNYFISYDEFSEAIVRQGLAHGIVNGMKAWVIDASSAKGALSADIIELLDSEIYPSLVQYGIMNILLIKPVYSALSKLTVNTYTKKAIDHGLTLIPVSTMTDALKWLMLNRDTSTKLPS